MSKNANLDENYIYIEIKWERQFLTLEPDAELDINTTATEV